MRIEELIRRTVEQEAAFPINDAGLGRLLRDISDVGEDPARPVYGDNAATAARKAKIYAAIESDVAQTSCGK